MKTSVLIAAAVLQTVGVFASPTWTFIPAGASVTDGSAGTIASSDGVWELNVLVASASNKTLSLGSKKDSQQTGGGHAFVRGSGDLDLRGAVTRANTSEAWKITHITWGALGRGASSGFVGQGSLFAPTTLVSLNRCFACVDSCYQSFTNVVIESSAFNQLYEQVFTSGVDTNLNRLVFKTPALATIPNNGISVSWANPDNASQPKLWGSSYDEWDLTGVTSIGDYAFFGRHIHGTLNLPKISSIGNFAFHECTNIVRALLSPDLKLLKYVGMKAFNQNQWGTNRYVDDSTLREVVMGGAFGFTITTNAFSSQKALSSVSFTGAKPIYDINDGGIVFGTTSRPAKSMAFYVPDNEEWADVIAQATPATDAEKSAWSAAHPDYLPIWGVIPASVFHTANDQYIGYYAKRIKKPELFFDARLGDNATFESLGPWPAASDGSWPTNNSFRITATVGAGGTFTRWYGDMPKDLCRQQSIEVTGDRLVDVKWLLPRITHPWTFDTVTKTISNGIWVLHVYYASSSRLTLGNETGTWHEYGRTLTGTGSGYLDLGGPITDANGNNYTIINLQGGDYGLGGTETKAGPSVFVSPGTLTGDFLKYRHFQSSQASYSDLEVVVTDEPNIPGGFANGWWFNNTKVRYLQFIVPKVPNISNNTFNRYGMSPIDINFSQCDFSGVTNVGTQAFYFSTGARGAVDLPSVKRLGEAAFYGAEGIQGVCLATNRHSAIEAVGSQAFRGCLSLEKVVLNQAAGTTWPANGFTECPLREIRFLCPPPTLESLRNMLNSIVETTGGKQCTVYGSRANGTWSALASEPTVEELAAFTGDAADLFGVFRKNPTTTPALGNAWIVNRLSPWDPRGFLMRLR